MKKTSLFVGFAFGLLHITAVNAQSASDIVDYQTRAEKRIAEIRAESDAKLARYRRAEQNKGMGLSSGNEEDKKLPDLASYGAQWRVRAIRYSCAGGLSLNTKQRFSSAAFADAVSERRDLTTLAASASGNPLTKKQQSEIDALDTMGVDLKKVMPLELTFKYKKYEMQAERSPLGLQFTNRIYGVTWSQRNGKGTLKSTFSGRVIAHDCRAGVPFETDAAESFDSDLKVFTPELESIPKSKN